MIVRAVKSALERRELSIGTWIQIGHPAVAELLGELAFDWIAVDCEHSDIDIHGFAQVIRGLEGKRPVPLVRVRNNSTMAIRQFLDLGAAGVIVPLVNTADEAKSAVAAAKFPPDGIRGFAFCRANNHGLKFDEYARDANDSVAVVVMVETREAVENIDEILSVSGVDGIFIGPYDLSGSYGVVGQPRHPLVLAAIKQVVGACRQAGKSAGVHIVEPDPAFIQETIADGFSFIAVGMDTVFLKNSASAALDSVIGKYKADD